MDAPSSVENGDDEDTSSPSSPVLDVHSPLHSMPSEFRSALDDFRDNWQRELKSSQTRETHGASSPVTNIIHEASDIQRPLSLKGSTCSEADQQTLAVNLFRRGVELEQSGKVYDALPFYRKAIQIVPDIEKQYYDHQKKVPAQSTDTMIPQDKIKTERDCENVDITVADLYEKFQLDLARDYGGTLLRSNHDASVLSTELHIADLPPEIILYILRWVVSAQLDLRSLEQCAAVCKGMYLCARDEDIWRLACVKVWGLNVGTLANPSASTSHDEIDAEEHPTFPGYTSWRQMFIERERVLFNGCYISKTTYLRMGENSFQDQYYRPVQLVEYYRYLRFLPDGTVLMMTNADEPAQGVTKLKYLQQLRPDVLRGHYRLYGSTVTILLKKQQTHQQRIMPTAHQYARHRRGSSAFPAEEANSTQYCLEFRIMNTPKRKFSHLIWLHYSIVQTRNKVESSSEFDLTPSKYPPLWFSPVRSYHLDAEAPLG